ncbi:MAG TPA: TonB-dependent receptor [Usitatibacter sp.]|nr:TonB-dependent receptor [Usitatibacter sp.]
MKKTRIAFAISSVFLATTVSAQVAQRGERIEVTGSNIKRIQAEGALPVQIISRQELERAGITSAEQLIMQLSSNANGLDNLASNSDVVAGASRGNNGAASANLRGQGANATLILLNGRRIAAHGLNGGVVDLNSIPMAAIDRIEVLKDGASAIYGTDAVGGVINFITRKDFTGVNLQAYGDKTEAGGGDIYRFSATGGMGTLERDGFNVMGTVTYRQNKALRGSDRDFVNTFQVDRGLSVDTRGTPIATVVPISSIRTVLSSRNAAGAIVNGTGPTLPGGNLAFSGGINVLDLPGGAGCSSIDGMAPYDEVLWATPNARFACAWDTGRAAMIQQPVDDLNFMGRVSMKVGSNATAFVEVLASKVDTKKEFSNNQLTSSTSTTSALFNLTYPSTGAAYNQIFNALVAAFPSIEENRGQGIAFRWRCMPCGPRRLDTEAKADRILAGIEGAFGNWDYRAGVSRARSQVVSTIGSGYYFDDQFFPLIRTGVINPFSITQTPEAVAAIAATSAAGVKLYGGQFTLDEVDATVSGPVFKMPAGDVMIAAGVDLRREKYKFNGDERDLANQRGIFNVPFDNPNALGGVSRDIKAAYGEVLVPLLTSLELSAAVRHDDYTGFGGTTNPKVSLRYQPVSTVVLRGGYNTGFRVPTFNQLFNGLTESPFTGATLVDFSRCPAGVVSANPGCEAIRPVIFTGGKPDLGPEESRQYNFGVVLAPVDWFSATIDYWDIEREGTIQLLDLTTLSRNFAFFPQRFARDASGNIVVIDNRWVNAGTTKTRGIDVNARANGRVGPGRFLVTLDGTYLLEKKSKPTPIALYSDELAVFSRSGDLGLRWKHNATFTYMQGNWSATLQQLYSSGYRDFVLPGVANGSVSPPNWKPDVEAYLLHNVSVTWTGIKRLSITAGIKNILDKDPPFTVAYDSNTGAGSSWEPRVADPRGRSYTLLLSYTF